MEQPPPIFQKRGVTIHSGFNFCKSVFIGVEILANVRP